MEVQKGLNERLGFLDGVRTDILVRPGSGPAIPAHRAVLAITSEIFRIMLGSDDECKAPAGDTISLPELSYDELHCLLEFLYCGDLVAKKVETHAHSLLVAADKYDIPYLKEFCEHRLLKSLAPSNALKVLELSDVCSNRRLKKHAMSFIIKHAEDVVSSKKYYAFTLKNAHLSVEITRELLMEMKQREMDHASVIPPKRKIILNA